MNENKRYRMHPRDENETKKLKTRINKMIGQLNGISSMLDENRYCGDILIQISAVEAALQQFGYLLLSDHLHSCVASDIKSNCYDSLDESIELMKKLK